MTAEATTKLPPGWWIRTHDGSFAGPPPIPQDYTNDDDSEVDGVDGQSVVDDEGGLDIRPDSPGWEDMEADTESLTVQCLLCPQQFSSPNLMLEHCSSSHNFDFVNVVRSRGLDFYGAIKLVNLVRSQVPGLANPDQLAVASLDSDDLLKPVLENDALLFSLDDVVDFEALAEQTQEEAAGVDNAG
ncbi:uncharacterized protein LTR77_000577 [Saxophila tyrrhenica]|uniref:type I protein arginine methyltransferase n=1 Tax=Saxophila tyrrhenica TaxID=1690608 RepID=A0AAV9PSX0_9PEZI|nr:hypothetical protein LTR77_000577 [Saxophila tyrrhenica]